MKISPHASSIPRKKLGPIDPLAADRFPREVGGMIGGRFQPGFTEAVMAWFKGAGWMAYHTKNSTGSQRGFPDLVAVYAPAGIVIFAELKTEDGKVDSKQEEWLLALAKTDDDVYLWRPSDEGEILATIQHALDLAYRDKIR